MSCPIRKSIRVALIGTIAIIIVALTAVSAYATTAENNMLKWSNDSLYLVIEARKELYYDCLGKKMESEK